MVRNIIFRNLDLDEELQMPVAPSGYDLEEGRRVETLDMADIGQVNLPGLEKLFSKSHEFLLPATQTSYCTGAWQDPWEIVTRLSAWSLAGNVVRYIVTGTEINVPVLIETVRFKEQDGTNDVYLTLDLRQYRYLTAPSTVLRSATDNAERPDEDQISTDRAYTVQAGDSLWSIAYLEYGDGLYCYRLTTYNGLSSLVIHPGEVLQLPPKDVLDATELSLVPTQTESEKKYQNSLWDLVQKKTYEAKEKYDAYMRQLLTKGQHETPV